MDAEKGRHIMEELDISGFSVVRRYFDSRLSAHLYHLLERTNAFRYDGSSIGLLSDSSFAAFASDAIRSFSAAYVPVKAFVLDKSLDSNWTIPWHQDTKIAVQRQLPVDGYTHWTLESGIVHVQPPLHILESMVTLRIPLDDCQLSNGAIHIKAATHSKGVLDPNAIEHLAQTIPSVIPELYTGDIMLFRPLVLHYSPPSASSRPRRVLHVECCSRPLCGGLEWHN